MISVTEPPLVSVCMIVKNGMPYLPEALASLRSQSYKKLELIVQDSCSTDGTTEYLNQFQKQAPFPVSINTELDEGIADGINRAWKRAQGSIFALLEADNTMQENHIAVGVDFFLHNPKAAVLSTSQNIIDEKGNYLYSWTASPYDFIGHLCAESVIPSGSAFMNKSILGDRLYYNVDKKLGHCPDYEFWLRAGTWGDNIVVSEKITYNTRLSNKSGSCDYSRYEEFCENKLHGLNLFLKETNSLDSLNNNFQQLTHSLINRAKAGIYIWAASHVLNSINHIELTERLYSRAKLYSPNYFRVLSFGKEYEKVKSQIYGK